MLFFQWMINNYYEKKNINTKLYLKTKWFYKMWTNLYYGIVIKIEHNRNYCAYLLFEKCTESFENLMLEKITLYL